jgi:hypothetical protein
MIIDGEKMEKKLKHLELIQNIITRMANNSFLLKGWNLTLLAALIGLNKENGLDGKVVFICFILILVFWILDSYYLSQERIFRARYEEVRVKLEQEIDFSMKLESVENNNTNWFIVFWSMPLSILYIGLIASLILFTYFLK